MFQNKKRRLNSAEQTSNESAPEQSQYSLSRFRENLKSFCSHRLAETARVRKYGKDYMKCSGSRIIPNEDGNDKIHDVLVIDDIGEGIMHLGRETHVPSDDEDIREFEEYLRGVVTELVNSSMASTGVYWKIQPLGNFQTDTNVLELGEFSYLCLPSEGTTLDSGNIENSRRKLSEKLKQVLQGERLFRRSTVCDQGSAVSIEFQVHRSICEQCNKRHDAKVTVDITVACKRPEDSKWRDNLPEPLKFLAEEESGNFFLSNYHESSYEFCDNKIFDKFSETCQIDLRCFYRALRSIYHAIGPFSRVELRGAELVHPRALKCYMFNEILENPDPQSWRKDQLVFRLAGILGRLLRQVTGPMPFKPDDTPKFLDPVSGIYAKAISIRKATIVKSTRAFCCLQKLLEKLEKGEICEYVHRHPLTIRPVILNVGPKWCGCIFTSTQASLENMCYLNYGKKTELQNPLFQLCGELKIREYWENRGGDTYTSATAIDDF